nr:unnamed protein product [Callosobruchus chinensis]
MHDGEAFHAKLCALPWNTWNVRNRKSLLIILPKTMKPSDFSFASVVVNYQFLQTVTYWHSAIWPIDLYCPIHGGAINIKLEKALQQMLPWTKNSNVFQMEWSRHGYGIWVMDLVASKFLYVRKTDL